MPKVGAKWGWGAEQQGNYTVVSLSFSPSSRLSGKSWEILLRGNRIKWALRTALKEKGYTGWKRELRWPVVARQPDLCLTLRWMCAHKPQVFFNTFWQCLLPLVLWCLPRILISSVAPNPALGTTGSLAEPSAQFCAEAVCYSGSALGCLSVLHLVLESCFSI